MSDDIANSDMSDIDSIIDGLDVKGIVSEVVEKFNESHDHLGRFATHGGTGGAAADTGGGSGGSTRSSTTVKVKYDMVATKRVGKKLVLANGSSLPSHVSKLRIPPAWKNVEISKSPKSALLVRGKDEKGRVQSVYSADHSMKKAAVKFARTKELIEKTENIAKQNARNMKSSDPKIKEAASVMSLIQSTGIRPGSDRDTGADKKAYGATTLEARHVKKTSSGVVLKFTGKKGVSLSIPVNDKSVASMLLARKKTAESRGGKNGKLFDTNDNDLRKYSKTLDGGKMKPKDFRTAKGTSEAIKLVASMKPPKTEEEYKRSVKEVGDHVAGILGNTRAIALQSYISPMVFSKWRNNL